MLIAQISDIHASPGNDGLVRLMRAISWLATMQPAIVVVSGDLVNGGWREGYRQIIAALQSLACRTLILPGNVDDRTIMREAIPEASHWGDDEKMHFAEPRGDALIVGLDTCVDGHAHGDVTDHLAWLRQTLASGPSRIPLLFTHHHVFLTGIRLWMMSCAGVQMP
ncbi:metallophosphoesterase [Rhizobium mongolense]|uniref:3',5'-cyclic AMP phosphodiesterase CpdA n=1 Tax=Rhizobium mongolense TaxID=57676 RepID=A0ABR6IJM5_9HYPH|nr:metallophosphoesterase [Rhizobium mongolense]MBB4228068.1 3',5'-cyclic AMP phosphodiesterase CpdA [Rhizobium mongolense]